MELRTRCKYEGCGGWAYFVVKDEVEALELAKQRKLEARCVRCDRQWVLPEQDQIAVEKSLEEHI